MELIFCFQQETSMKNVPWEFEHKSLLEELEKSQENPRKSKKILDLLSNLSYKCDRVLISLFTSCMSKKASWLYIYLHKVSILFSLFWLNLVVLFQQLSYVTPGHAPWVHMGYLWSLQKYYLLWKFSIFLDPCTF